MTVNKTLKLNFVVKSFRCYQGSDETESKDSDQRKRKGSVDSEKRKESTHDERKKKTSDSKQKKGTNDLKKKETKTGTKADKKSDGSGKKTRTGNSAMRSGAAVNESEEPRHGWLPRSNLTFVK